MSRFAVDPANPIQAPPNPLNRTATEKLYNSDGWNNQTLVPFDSECPFVLAENSTGTTAFSRVRKNIHFETLLRPLTTQ